MFYSGESTNYTEQKCIIGNSYFPEYQQTFSNRMLAARQNPRGNKDECVGILNTFYKNTYHTSQCKAI